MKITKQYIKQLIKEELENIDEIKGLFDRISAAAGGAKKDIIGTGYTTTRSGPGENELTIEFIDKQLRSLTDWTFEKFKNIDRRLKILEKNS